MDLNRDRRELVEMINQIQSAQVIAHLKEVVEDLSISSEGFELTEKHKRILDQRIDKYRSGQGKLYSWEEVLERVRK